MAPLRIVWFIFGFTALLLGVIGAFLPLLPTVPFLLLAAFCFARSSDRWHSWLVTHRSLGPSIQAWQKTRSIGRRAKIFASVSILASFLVSMAMDVPMGIMGVQGVVLLVVSYFIWSRPEA
ncbi:MAG: YbaN family protein [Rhodobacterales bacterium]